MTTIAAVRDVVHAARSRGERIALVPTMGALHEGHLALVEAAHEHADVVVVSIFVNPMQFGPTEDLARYPRDLDADRARLAEAGVAAIFAPTAEEMYPTGAASPTVVTAGHLGTVLEGRSRRGHYDGVLTVVSKLLHIVAPDVACFGEKDAQQLFLVRRMVRDLDMPVEIVGVPTVRDADGLALSSRNRFLSGHDRRTALTLSRALEAAGASADRGVEAMIAAAQGVIQSDTGVQLDYLAVVDPATFAFVGEAHHGPVQVLVAARVGDVRLIDTATFAIP
ncbi:pantoate--beta-alanine ligase [Agrococcus sp. SGAir0287]|uniref:pantoate--beta-alanine ligase n=1 Tax=Agrococcus sp. SGAir0287 TaxID=2070347 RepID=UPI001C2F65C4|nr:pantoate--beta-alanine ligase [Agrococcus sp. SGAir0287]